MVGRCCICKKTYTKEGTIQLFTFPQKNLARRQSWLDAVQPLGIEPTPSSRVCNEHFLESDFEIRTFTGKTRLREFAVPTQNLSRTKTMAPRPILPKPNQAIKKEPEILTIKQEPPQSPYILAYNNDHKVICVKDIYSLNQSLKKNANTLVGGLSVLNQSTPIIQSVTSLNPTMRKSLTKMPMIVKTIQTAPQSENLKTIKMEVSPLVMRREAFDKKSVAVQVKKNTTEKRNAGVQVKISTSKEVIFKKKIKTLQQKVRRMDKRISCLKELLYALKKKGLLEPDASEMIDHYFDDSD